MKLTMEIKDEQFLYEYSIGKDERHCGIEPLTGQALRHFTQCMDDCNKLFWSRQRLIDEELIAKCYIERHPELLVKKGWV